ncbi:MAG: response regulator [Clostridium sp.]|nr:response regulator [Clostridium sp.]
MYSILIVDDERIERRGIKFLLKQIGVNLDIYEASNGKEALEFLNDNEVDILFTDIKMPFMDGIALINEVKKREIKSKIVIFSGYEEFEYAKFATKMGVLNYILKPVNPKEFEETIARIIKDIDKEKQEDKVKNMNMDFMKEHILFSLVNGAKYEELLNKTKSIISLDFLKSYNRMFLVEFNNDFFGQSNVDFSSFIHEKLNYDFQYLNLNLRQSLLIFNKIHGDTEQLKTIGQNIHDSVFEMFNINCYITIGSEFNDIRKISECFNKMELIMEKKFYNTNTYVFMEDDDIKDKSNESDDNIVKLIKQNIKVKDIESLKKNFDLLCSKYSKEGSISQIYLKFIFSEILKDLYKSLKEIDEEDFKNDIAKLYKASDFTNVMSIINDYIGKLSSSVENNTSLVHKEIESVKKFILENYEKDLSVDTLASNVCLAPSYLSYVFKKETGQNISKFIKACRMNKAKDLLENSYEKIVNISYAVGYRNVSYFCQSFREYFGVSPQKYRNEGDSINEDK